MHTFNVDPADPDEGIAAMLTALGEARIEVRGVAVTGFSTPRYSVRVDGKRADAERILETIGYRVHRDGGGLAA